MSVILPLASSTVAGVIGTGTETIAGAKTFNDVMTFNASAGAVAAGSYATSGAWTLGSTSGSAVIHTLQSGGTGVTLQLLPPQSGNTSARINLQAFGTGIPQIYWYNGSGAESGAIYATTAGVFTFQYDTTFDWQRVGVGSIASCNASGQWSFGGPTGSLTHVFGSGSSTTLSIATANAVGDSTLILSNSGQSNTFLAHIRATDRLVASNGVTGTGPYVASGGTTWTNGTSDERLKTNIEVIPNCLNKLMQVRPVTYKLTADGEAGRTRAGILAQDLLAAGYAWPVDTSNPDKYGVTFDEMSALYIGAIKELNQKFEDYVATHP